MQCRQFRLQQGAATGVFVTQVDIYRFRLDGPGRDQRPFDETVRVEFQVITVLERPRFAFIDVDGNQPGPGLTAQDAPFPSRRETGAAQAAQVGLLQHVDDLFGCMAAVHAVRQQLVAALIAVARIADRIRHRACGIPVLHGGGDRFRLGMLDRVGSHHGHRRCMAAAHAGNRLNPYPVRVRYCVKLVDQPGRTEHFAGQ